MHSDNSGDGVLVSPPCLRAGPVSSPLLFTRVKAKQGKARQGAPVCVVVVVMICFVFWYYLALFFHHHHHHLTLLFHQGVYVEVCVGCVLGVWRGSVEVVLGCVRGVLGVYWGCGEGVEGKLGGVRRVLGVWGVCWGC